MFLKNRNIISKIKRSKVTDYAALSAESLCCLYLHYIAKVSQSGYLIKQETWIKQAYHEIHDPLKIITQGFVLLRDFSVFFRYSNTIMYGYHMVD